MVAKPGACETRRGLRIGGCGAWLFCRRRGSQAWSSVSGSAWDGVPERVRVPYVKMLGVFVTEFPSSSGLVESAVNLPGPPGKPEYSLMTDSG